MTEILRTETRKLPCDLTDAEMASLGERVGAIASEVAVLEGRKKAITGAISELKAQSDDLAEMLRFRREMRQVRCEVRLDFDLGEAFITRNDTGRLIERRPLTEAERQIDLPYDSEDETEAEAGSEATENKTQEGNDSGETH